MSHNKLTDPIHAPVCMGDAVVCNFVDCDFFSRKSDTTSYFNGAL